MKSFLLRKVLPIIGGITALLLLPRVSSFLGPEVPSVSTLVPTTVAAPSPSTPQTTRPPLPEGFPSMLFPPPKIDVEPGQPQPIDTRYGLTYEIPADWKNDHGASSGWSGEEGHAVYGSVGSFGYGSCPEKDGGWLAMSGVAGSRDIDLETVATESIRDVEWIFDDNAGTRPTVEYAAPVWFEIADRPAVRISARITDIPQVSGCEPDAARFDIVATPGYATAQTMVLMVQVNEGAYDVDAADDIIATLRPS